MSETRWGIIGSGAIAHTFANALEACENQHLLAVLSRDSTRAKDFASGYPPCRGFASMDAFLSQTDIDAVYVASPHPNHASHTMAALRAGKHVLCEKPMGLNHAEVMAMIQCARENQRFLMEAFMYRLHPQTHRVLELIDTGAIGEVCHLDAQFGYRAEFNAESRLFANHLGGGGIMDVGCYPVSLARLLFGEPTEISGHGRLGATGVDAWANALFKFADGKTAQLGTGVELLLRNHAIIYGTDAQLEIPKPWRPDQADGDWHFLIRRGDAVKEIWGTNPNPYILEAEHVHQLLNSGAEQSPACSWADSLGNAHALDQWRRQIGLIYDREQPDKHPGPILALHPGRRQDIPQAQVPFSEKPVSRLVMGCDNQPSMAHASVMWDHFMEAGGNCFDTAYIYGQGSMEQLLGHWHTRRGIREQLFIVGKGAHTPDCFPDAISRELDVSLARLQTDYVDMYFMHRDNLDVPVGEFVDALETEVRRGRIRAYGGSNWSLERTRALNEYAAANGTRGFSAISNQFSLAQMNMPIWEGTADATSEAFKTYLTETGMVLFPWSSQARGFFTPWAESVMQAVAQPDNLNPITFMQPTAAELSRVWFSDLNFGRRKRAQELADQHRVSLINIALAYVLHQTFGTFPLVGPRNLEETESCIIAAQINLTAEDVAYLERGA